MRPDIEDAIFEMYHAMDRAAQTQIRQGRKDQGRRSAITSGKHLDPVASIIKSDLLRAGFNEGDIFSSGRSCTLPGWFRPTKNWDLLAFDNGELVSAIELKSISSSFGNNLNNRTEESIGSAVDAQEAFNERLFGPCNIPPVMGYAMIALDCPESRATPSRQSASQHFSIDPEFENASYLDRLHILCERLRRKSLYNAVWLVFANMETHEVYEPDPSMTYEVFMENINMGLNLHRLQGKR